MTGVTPLSPRSSAEALLCKPQLIAGDAVTKQDFPVSMGIRGSQDAQGHVAALSHQPDSEDSMLGELQDLQKRTQCSWRQDIWAPNRALLDIQPKETRSGQAKD